ncbi:MAG TPA: winged helix DNA-binding domain-containing protein [Vicinamibacterales bacterium]|nr:winged helix DNA-binding domain-containing protein [Vicinamibacterales bacterium]
MTTAQQRLRTQRLAGPGFDSPAEVVRWLGAVQAQDFAGALWAVGMRTTGATAAEVEAAIAARAIVRTWPLRGTIHFVAPQDVRWMLAHFAPRTIARAAPRFRQLELDARVLAKSGAIIVRALEGGRQLTRPRLYALLERAGIVTRDNRGLHILWRCAHDGLICFAAREGKQAAFALLDEWVPGAGMRDRDDALAELAGRYFASHGPATLQDFIWWSGLSAADGRKAVALAGPRPDPATARHSCVRSPHAVLLPPYDEYTVAYRDRSAAVDPAHAGASRNGIFSPTIVLDGRIAGTWTRRIEADAVTVALKPFATLSGAKARRVAREAIRYGTFIGRPARVAWIVNLTV